MYVPRDAADEKGWMLISYRTFCLIVMVGNALALVEDSKCRKEAIANGGINRRSLVRRPPFPRRCRHIRIAEI